MTEKLFYNDPFLKEFTATVLSCEEGKNGWAVTLDRTAFYPEGGGQPADFGTLGAVKVTDTRDKGGVVTHICDGPLTVGSTVTGRIDFDRRFDFMQQHSGEHIVSGMICEAFHCDNVGFHVGHDVVTIDFNAEMTMADLRDIELRANRYIWENHPIVITYPSPEELAALDDRSKKELSGQVRIVSYPGADCCACCGTHVTASGQVGLVKLLSCQKFREGVRIEMVSGKRALDCFTTTLEQNTRVSQLLCAKPTATSEAVERLQKQVYALQGRITALEESDFERKAQQLTGAGDTLLVEGPMSSDSVRKLCNSVMLACGGRCAVFAGEGGVYQYAIGQEGGDLRALGKALNAALSGRGGGKPNFIQGSVSAEETAIRAFFTEN